jgi:MFS transporter, MFS domain-containing protein family, molybdate-anion transporter
MTDRNFFYLGFYGLTIIACVVASTLDFSKRKRLRVEASAPFCKFQLTYLSVLSLVYMGDWLQGSYLYPLYKSYGYSLEQIALLFVIGFGASALFGTIVGSWADKWGRKLCSLTYCLLAGISCMTKLSSNFQMLILGRITGGISASLLFSVFESWLVSAHDSHGFDKPSLYSTFAWATFINGLVAIISGLIANTSVNYFGLVSPFRKVS